MKLFIRIVLASTLVPLSLMVLSCATTKGPVKSKDGLFQYAKDDKYGGIEILAYFGNEKELIIPERIDGKKVTVIGFVASGGLQDLKITGAFEGKNLTKVTIPDGVVRIWDNAFSNNLLITVTLPSSIQYLSGFNGNQLTSIVIPPNVTKIGGLYDNPLASITFTGLVSEDIISDNALGDLTPWYAVNNRKPGAYTLNKNKDGWEYNGNPIADPAMIEMPDNITLLSIDGNNAQFMNVGQINPWGRNKRNCYIPAGKHSLVIRRQYYGAGWKVESSDYTITDFDYLGYIIYELEIEVLANGKIKYELGVKKTEQ